MKSPLSIFKAAAYVTPSSARVPISLCKSSLATYLQKRSITADEKPLPKAPKHTLGPNQEQLPHVSEEAAAIGKITGEGGPETEQGTPVQEVLQRDEKGQENAPKVLQEQLRPASPQTTRKFSTIARRPHEIMTISDSTETKNPGYIFPPPESPLPKHPHLQDRYDPLLEQVTNLIMRSGKKAVAQRLLATILNDLRTSPPPTLSPTRPLLAPQTPASHLPLDPVRYLQVVIDSVAPLLRMRSLKGAAGGGVALQIPVPLQERQRRRVAVKWIMEAASKRRGRGSGQSQFAHKVAEEVISIAEGRSTVWERRTLVHKMGVSARSNLKTRFR